MGLRGPAATPIELLKKRDSWRAGINKHAPTAPTGIPDRPGFLSERAGKYWDRTCAILSRMGLLNSSDGDLITAYVLALDHLTEVETILQREGLTYEIRDNADRVISIRKRPEASMLGELLNTVNRLGSQFGLSPAARARVQVERGVTESEDVDQFFKVG